MIYHISWYIIQKLWLVDDYKGFYFTFLPGTITIHEGKQNTAQVTYNKDSKDITVEDPASDSSADPVCGEYECSQYVDNGSANDWHYVTVTQEEKGYKWTNRGSFLDVGCGDLGHWRLGGGFQVSRWFKILVSCFKSNFVAFLFPHFFRHGMLPPVPFIFFGMDSGLGPKFFV